jgi:hypothetical protein
VGFLCILWIGGMFVARCRIKFLVAYHDSVLLVERDHRLQISCEGCPAVSGASEMALKTEVFAGCCAEIRPAKLAMFDPQVLK